MREFPGVTGEYARRASLSSLRTRIIISDEIIHQRARVRWKAGNRFSENARGSRLALSSTFFGSIVWSHFYQGAGEFTTEVS